MFWAFLSGLAVVRVMFNPEVLQIVIAVAFLAVTAVLVWLWEKARKNKPEEVKGHGA